jgi:hypothetical protein
MNLFQMGSFRLTSGMEASYKIECDALTDDDWTCIAYLLFQKLDPFGYCEGVPRGGLKLAEKMQKYWTPGSSTVLIVDDVWTTGGSMRQYGREVQEKSQTNIRVIGAVVFARYQVERWVTPLFQM